ncbi:MAG TPA: hypothetical protein VH331_16095 [Allosphingosinicella sp.]|jgi:hypothetical protein|nr:hypothetical protein [Allosphingosinicella sp.]
MLAVPNEGVSEGSVFLGHIQATNFASRTALPQTVSDSDGRIWALEEGLCDADERNYGLFDGSELIARLTIVSPAITANDCPTPFWSVGRIEVADRCQRRGIASGLATAVVAAIGMPLASDLDQTPGGASVWKRLIRENPGAIELHDANGLIGSVTIKSGVYEPDPWAARATRLVRHS